VLNFYQINEDVRFELVTIWSSMLCYHVKEPSQPNSLISRRVDTAMISMNDFPHCLLIDIPCYIQSGREASLGNM
jgi:hypothetical protein